MIAPKIAQRIAPRSLRFAVTGVLAAVSLAGCASTGKVAKVEGSASQAQAALAQGKVGRAVNLAETAVEADPRSAEKRALLGHAYLKSGRFDSAATSFNDAMTLGDNSTRTALALALSKIGAGRNAEAVALLDDWRDSIPSSDLGLALALAGETGRGVAILADAIRSGDNNAKTRQNLAYAYALDGRWREARMMASQDVPADQIDLRLGTWASTIQPEAGQQRVAALLDVPVARDAGQPARLALANTPSAEQLAAETAATRPDIQPVAELPATSTAVAEPAVAVAAVNPGPVESWTAPAPEAAPSVVSQPVVQPVAQPAVVRTAAAPRAVARPAVAAAAPRAVASRVDGTHLVQLGSFSSQQGARRAWGIFASRNPELKNTRMTITQAVVRGKTYWRVAAAGLNAGGASGLCSSVKNRGGACFAYAATTTVRGAVPAAPAGRASGPIRVRR